MYVNVNVVACVCAVLNETPLSMVPHSVPQDPVVHLQVLDRLVDKLCPLPTFLIKAPGQRNALL